MCAVCSTEGIVYIAVGIVGKNLREGLLALLDGFLGSLGLFFGSILGQSSGLAFLFGVEAEVLKQQGFAVLEGSNHFLSLLAVVGKLDVYAEKLADMTYNMLQTIFGVGVFLGAAKM